MLVQLLQLSVPLHLCGGGRMASWRRWRRSGGVEVGPRRLRLRLRLGGRRGYRDHSGRRLGSTLLDVVVLAQDAVVVQVEPISDAEPVMPRNASTQPSLAMQKTKRNAVWFQNFRRFDTTLRMRRR